MKIGLLFSFVLFTGSVFAKDYKLTDPAIRGEYKLQRANGKAEIQTAEIVYNEDKALVLRVERNESEYELSEPDANGVVFEGEDECNAGSGDEPNCYFDAKTVIKLKPVMVRGKEIPQLTIEITVLDGYDENYVETTSYVLNWSKALEHAVPFYINAKVPRELKNIIETCERELKDLGYDSATSYLSESAVCSRAYSFQYREPLDKAFAAIKEKWVGRNVEQPKELTVKAAQQLFKKAKALAKKYKGETGSSITSKMIIEQIDKVEAYVLAADHIYASVFISKAQFFIVDKDKKIITRLEIQISNKH